MPDYFTLDEFRLLPDMDSGRYDNARIEAVAASLTAIVEREVGTSFVLREVTDAFRPSATAVLLRTPYARSVTSVAVGGDVQAGDYEAVNGVLFGPTDTYNASPWREGVTVTYMAGQSVVPPDLKEALMWAVRDRLLATSDTAGIEARRTSTVTDMGTINYVIAGDDRPTGYPDLDASIMGWRRKLRIPGVA